MVVNRDVLLTVAREGLGLVGLALIVAGVWGLGGWPYASIVAGLPLAVSYVRGEWRSGSTSGHHSGEG